MVQRSKMVEWLFVIKLVKKRTKEDFINEFRLPYIIIAPDKKGLIVDFSLDISFYAALTEAIKS